MMYASQPGIDVLTDYLQEITAAYPDGEDTGGPNQLKLCLRIFRQALKAHDRNECTTVDWLEHYRTGSRLAYTLLESLLADEVDAFIGWSPGNAIQNGQRKLALILGWAITDLNTIIWTQEARWPELKPALDRERAQYRRMKEEAEDALRNP